MRGRELTQLSLSEGCRVQGLKIWVRIAEKDSQDFGLGSCSQCCPVIKNRYLVGVVVVVLTRPQ